MNPSGRTELLVFAHALFPDLSEGLTCLQCKNVATPRECIRVTQCQAGEVCIVVLYVYTAFSTDKAMPRRSVKLILYWEHRPI